MKLEDLTFINFMAFAGEHRIHLGGVGTCVIVGDNGVGKSSILEGVQYALFGKTRAGTEDELSHGHDKFSGWAVPMFSVGCKFTMNGKTYEVVRSRSSRKGELTFKNLTDGLDLTANGIRETQAVIHKIIGMEYESFVSSVMLQQDDYDEFMKMTPGDAKEVVLEILGLDSFEAKRELAAERAKTAQVQSDEAERTVQSSLSELEGLKTVPSQIVVHQTNIESIKTEIAQATKGMEEGQALHARMKAACDKVHEAYERLDKIAREESQALAEKTANENHFDRLLHSNQLTPSDVTDKKSDEQANQVAIARSVTLQAGKYVNELSAQIPPLAGRLTSLRDRASKLDQKRKVQPGASMCLLGKQECHTELLNQIETEFNAVVAEGKQAREEHDKVNQTLTTARFAYETSATDERLQQNIMACIGSWSAVLSARARYDSVVREKATLQDMVKDNAVTTDDVRAKELEVASFKMRKDRLQAQADEVLKQIGQLQEALKRKEKLEKDVEIAIGRQKDLKESVAVYSTLARAFSKEGIPALMIESIVPVLESDANLMLDRLTDGKIKLQFLLQRKLKGGGLAESFEIYVTDGNGTRAIQMYSGGEKYRIIFAVHSAFSKYLTYRSGAQISFLAIDEPAGLDDAGIQRLVETLSVLKENYEQIFVITHLRELMDHFPQTIVVERNGNSSKVTVSGRKHVTAEDIL